MASEIKDETKEARDQLQNSVSVEGPPFFTPANQSACANFVLGRQIRDRPTREQSPFISCLDGTTITVPSHTISRSPERLLVLTSSLDKTQESTPSFGKLRNSKFAGD